MGLMDELLQELSDKNDCPVKRLIEKLPANEREAIRDALINPMIPVIRLLTVLRRNGYKLGDSSAYNHRKGFCKCH